MAQASAAANENGAYTLSDRGTWLNMVNLGTVKNLKIVNQGDNAYWNPYSVITGREGSKLGGCADFSRWIRSSTAQSIIKEYGESTFGVPLFNPYANQVVGL